MTKQAPAGLRLTLAGQFLADIRVVIVLLMREAPDRTVKTLILVNLVPFIYAITMYVLATDLIGTGSGASDVFDATVFVLVLCAFIVSNVVASRTVGRLMAHVMAGMASRLSAAVLNAELVTISSVGQDRILTGLTRHLAGLSTALPSAIWATQTATSLLAVGLLIMVTEPVMAVIVFALIAMALALGPELLAHRRSSGKALAAAEGSLLTMLRQATSSARELNLNAAKRDDLYGHGVLPAIGAAMRARKSFAVTKAASLRESLLVWFGILGGACFILPAFAGPEGAAVVAFLAVFLRPSLVDASSYLEALNAARQAIEQLDELEVALAQNTPATPRRLTRNMAPMPPPTFKILDLEDMTYSHPGPSGARRFSIGPINLSIRAGEIVLVSGPNGSGKSTLLNVLAGLASPTGGRVLIDGQPISAATQRQYFSAVFSDFHLFRKLHGVYEPDRAFLERWLRLLQLDGSVALDGRRFSTTRLSTGQRRRLALVAALAERRPLLLCDEWTADQDPAFRRMFFSTLLPELRDSGFTVIAVTHDDNVLNVADQHVMLRDGQQHR